MNILLVDDSKTMLHQGFRLLNELGYKEVCCANTVDQAIEMLSTQRFDLIISDWHMPNKTGLDLLKHVRTNPATIAVAFIMVTTEQERSNIVLALKSGVNSYIFKPLTKEVLTQRLNDLSAKYGFMKPLDANAKKPTAA